MKEEKLNPTWEDLVVGKKIFNAFDSKEYEVIKVVKSNEEIPPYEVYVAIFDGEGSQIKCIYSRLHLFQWVFTHKQAIEIAAKEATSKARFLTDWVKTL